MAKIKMDCIFYDGMSSKPIQSRCRSLKKLYCSCEEQCSFYKSRSDYNMDGSRKVKSSGDVCGVEDAEYH